jgi:hypothetical protein
MSFAFDRSGSDARLLNLGVSGVALPASAALPASDCGFTFFTFFGNNSAARTANAGWSRSELDIDFFSLVGIFSSPTQIYFKN